MIDVLWGFDYCIGYVYYICGMSAVSLGICVLHVFDCLYYLMAYIYCLIAEALVDDGSEKQPTENICVEQTNLLTGWNTSSVSVSTFPSIKSLVDFGSNISIMPPKHFCKPNINQLKREPDLSKGN